MNEDGPVVKQAALSGGCFASMPQGFLTAAAFPAPWVVCSALQRGFTCDGPRCGTWMV